MELIEEEVSKMSCENMLELMKKALLIPANENYADDEIKGADEIADDDMGDDDM